MIRAFILGVWEFRHAVTTHTEHPVAYDWGREIAHRVTRRKFEQF